MYRQFTVDYRHSESGAETGASDIVFLMTDVTAQMRSKIHIPTVADFYLPF